MNKVLKQLESEVGRIQLCSLRPHALGPFLNYCFHCPPECVVDQLRAEGKWALISARGVREVFGVRDTGMKEIGKLRVQWGGAGKRWAKGVRTKAGGSGGFPSGSAVNLPARQETRLQSFGQEDPLEKGMATNSSVLACRIPWTEEPGGLQFMGSQSHMIEATQHSREDLVLERSGGPSRVLRSRVKIDFVFLNSHWVWCRRIGWREQDHGKGGR